MKSVKYGWIPLVAAMLLSPASALAQSASDLATGRALYFEGQAALDKKDYATAAERFARSDGIVHAPTALLGLARAQAGLGELVTAHETYNRIVREGTKPGAPPAFVGAVDQAKTELAALEPRLSSVVIKVEGATSPSVTIDGAAVPPAAIGVKRFVDPGNHNAYATAEGFLPVETKFTTAEGGSSTVTLKLKADPNYVPPKPPDRSAQTRRTIGFVVGGVGLASLAAAAVTGGLYLSEKGTAEQQCNANKQCTASGLSAVNSGKTLGAVNTVTFFAGVAALGAGATLVLLNPAQASAKPSVGVVVGPGSASVGCWGAF